MINFPGLLFVEAYNMSLSYQSHVLDIHDGKHSLVDCFLLNESMMVGLWRVSFNSWKKFIKAIEDFFLSEEFIRIMHCFLEFFHAPVCLEEAMKTFK